MEALRIISYSWPIAWMVFGAGAGFFIYLIVRRVTLQTERTKKIDAERQIELESYKVIKIEHNQ